jgi:hypothetical protein
MFRRAEKRDRRPSKKKDLVKCKNIRCTTSPNAKLLLWAVSRAAMEIIAANGFVYIETLYTINAIEQQWQQHGVWLDAHKALRRQLPLRRQPDGSLKPKVMLGAPACKEVQLRE